MQRTKQLYSQIAEYIGTDSNKGLCKEKIQIFGSIILLVRTLENVSHVILSIILIKPCNLLYSVLRSRPNTSYLWAFVWERILKLEHTHEQDHSQSRLIGAKAFNSYFVYSGVQVGKYIFITFWSFLQIC